MSLINDNPWLMLIAIFVINVAYVTALTMRVILTLKVTVMLRHLLVL